MLGRKTSPLCAGTWFVVTPWTCAYRPLKADAREGEHTGETVYVVAKRTPSPAIRSRLGVFTMGCPAQCMTSCRYSSAISQRMLGRARPPVWAAARPAAPSISSRRDSCVLIAKWLTFFLLSLRCFPHRKLLRIGAYRLHDFGDLLDHIRMGGRHI